MIKTMHFLATIVFSAGVLLGGMKTPARVAASDGFPQSFLDAIDPQLKERWASPSYFRVMTGLDLPKADAQGLFVRIRQASDDGQNYKALYLARIFTEAHPELLQGWANRSSIAATLGLRQEMASSLARSEGVSNQTEPKQGFITEILPGSNGKVRPHDLEDWAALIALLADGVASKEGNTALIAVRSDVSGLRIATPAEIAEAGQGPWADPKPLNLNDVATNLFCLKDAEPMHRSDVRKGLMFAAIASAALAGVPGADPANSAQVAESSGKWMEQAHHVASVYKGGRYKTLTYREGATIVTSETPTPSGQYEAVGLPIPVLWASGPSRSPELLARFVGDGGGRPESAPAIRRGALGKAHKKSHLEKLAARDLFYPKLATFGWDCGDSVNCNRKTIPMSIFEVMLNSSDLQGMFPGSGLRGFDKSDVEREYLSSRLTLIAGNTGNATLVGFDSNGSAHRFRHKETQWLTPAQK